MRLLTSREMATVGGKFTSRWTSLGFPVELGQLCAEVRAHVPHDLLRPLQVSRPKTLCRCLVRKTKWAGRMKTRCLPVWMSLYSAMKPKYASGVQLRYNYRLYPSPGQRDALARAFGCARVVFNDGLRARQEAHAAGLPYVTDGGAVGPADRIEGHPGAGMARRGVRRGAPAVPGGPEHGVPEFLRVGHREAERPEDRAASLQVPQGSPAGGPVHGQRPVPGAGQREAAAAEDRGRSGPLVPGSAV